MDVKKAMLGNAVSKVCNKKKKKKKIMSMNDVRYGKVVNNFLKKFDLFNFIEAFYYSKVY